MKLTDNELTIRTIQTADLQKLWEIAYRDNLEWMKWNGPYFHDPVYTQEEYLHEIGPKYDVEQAHKCLIECNGEPCGIITYSLEDGDMKRWLEFGLIIYSQQAWGHGIGRRCCMLWLRYLFQEFTHIQRIGFTTWSGNERMMRLGDKLGMTLEGRIRKVRYYGEQYWDSIKYGILREEFQKAENQIKQG